MLEEKITSRQMIFLMAITRTSISISTMPTINLPPYNQDMWIMVLLSIIYTTVMMIPLLFLANKFKKYSLIGYLQIIYGNKIGKIIGTLYGLFFILQSINGATIQSELVASTLLDDSSNIVVSIAFMIACIYCVSRGIANLTRAAEAFGPVVLIILVILLLLGLPNVHFELLKPVFVDSTLNDLSMGAFKLSLFYIEITFLAMLVPELQNNSDINKIFMISNVLTGILLAIIVVMTQSVMGIEYTRHANFPFLFYTRSIEQFRVFQRIDFLFVIGWLIASIGRISSFTYIAVRAFREVFNKKEDEKIILMVVGLIVIIATVVIIRDRSVIGIRKHFDLFYNILSLIYIISIPSITCIICFFRRKSIKNKGIV